MHCNFDYYFFIVIQEFIASLCVAKSLLFPTGSERFRSDSETFLLHMDGMDGNSFG